MTHKIISETFPQPFTQLFPFLLATQNLQKKDIVSSLLCESLRQTATDINIERASDDSYAIFFRIDGMLCNVLKLSGSQATTLRAALQNEAQDLHPGNHGVTEGTLTTQQHGEVKSFYFYDIPQSPTNSILIRAAHHAHTCTTESSITPQAKKTARNIDKKIFIWQMGKVGSSTIYRSLLPYSKPSTWATPAIQDNTHWPIHNNIIQTHSIALLYDFLHSSEEEFVIISLVRDPLARNISAIFQSMNYEEEWRNNYFIASVEEFKKMPYEQQEQEIALHLKRLNTSNAVTSWYDNILLSHFYYPEIDKYFIDIYAKPFDQEKGFQLYESKNPRINMIILRLENLNEQKGILGDFLGIDDFQLMNENIASEKWYNPIYKRFKEGYKPTKQELEAIYNSRFMKYFYSPEQIRVFTEKWFKSF